MQQLGEAIYSWFASLDKAPLRVQRYFKQWAMGRLDAQVFINKLNQLEAIQQIGPSVALCLMQFQRF